MVEKPDSILHKLVKKEVQKQRKIYVDVKAHRLYQANVSQKKENMENLIIYILLSPIGWLILLVKYRDFDKLKSVVRSEYDNDYSNAALHYLLGSFLVIFAILILALIVSTLIKSIF